MLKLKRVVESIVESSIRNLSGGLGQRLRYSYYARRFKACGKNVRIAEGVIIRGAEFITVGNDVWVDINCILIAGDVGNMSNRKVRSIRNRGFTGEEGELVMGSNIHLAPGCILHAFGGIVLEDNVGFSSGVKVYSMSNHHCDFDDKTVVTGSNPMVQDKPVVFVKAPIQIRENAFISLNTIVLMGEIGKNAFVAPCSVVSRNIRANSFSSGSPAQHQHDRFVESTDN